MSAAVAAPGSPKAAKPVKKASKSKDAQKSHPAYADMIKKAITELKEKKGSSRAAILKYILRHYNLGENGYQVSFFTFILVVFLLLLEIILIEHVIK